MKIHVPRLFTGSKSDFHFSQETQATSRPHREVKMLQILTVPIFLLPRGQTVGHKAELPSNPVLLKAVAGVLPAKT